MRIGLLAVQGSYKLHARALESINIETVEVRHASDLKNLSGIILPGGESTTFQIIMDTDGLSGALLTRLKAGLPAWGTCAGAILLGFGAGPPQPRWELVDVEVVRNAYGRQVDSFITPLKIKGFKEAFNGVFIRAPRFCNPGDGVEILAEYNGDPVMVKQHNFLLTSFHPELTSDIRIHKLFVNEFCK